MSEWLTYSLHDLLIFSPQSYRALFEIYHRQLWPWHLLTVCMTLAGFALLSTHKRLSQAGLLALSAAWLFLGLVFMQRYYAQINTLAAGLGWLFIFQAILLSVNAIKPLYADSRLNVKLAWLGYLFLLSAVVALPFLSVLDRSIYSMEIIGMTPDPTALLSIGLLIHSRLRYRYWLMLIPAAWLIISILTYLAMLQ